MFGGAMSFFYIMDDIAIEDPQWGADVAMLVAGGDIDFNATPQLRQRIVAYIEAGKRRLVIDLSQVTFIDSTAIGVLIGVLVRLQDAGGGSLTVVCDEDNKKVLRIFEIAGIEDVIEVHSTREEALSALAISG
jgi:anti-sigma B factor antagonist